jgi:hypothetical protein
MFYYLWCLICKVYSSLVNYVDLMLSVFVEVNQTLVCSCFQLFCSPDLIFPYLFFSKSAGELHPHILKNIRVKKDPDTMHSIIFMEARNRHTQNNL